MHRVSRGNDPWWRHAVVCDVAGGVDDVELTEFEGLLLGIARAGFSALLLRPARSNIVLDGQALAHVIERGHRAGLKVIVRLSGARLAADGEQPASGAFEDLEEGPGTLVVRTRAALKSGADGIDLGIIDEGDPTAAETEESRSGAARFSRLVRIEQAELADFGPTPILAAEALTRDRARFHRHLEEDWFHHLRDDALVSVPWDADQMRDSVQTSLQDRDRLGQVAAWHWSHTRIEHDPVGVTDGSWADGSSEARRTAMALYALSLPGAAYVPFSHLGGRAEQAAGRHLHRTWAATDQAEFEARLLARAIRLRSEHLMGTGSLAFVDNLIWAGQRVGVHMSAGVMVVVNTSDQPVLVPPEHHLLIASTGSEPQRGEPTALPPDSCGWFDTARVQPANVPVHD